MIFFLNMCRFLSKTQIMTSLKPRYIKKNWTDFFGNFVTINFYKFPTCTYLHKIWHKKNIVPMLKFCASNIPSARAYKRANCLYGLSAAPGSCAAPRRLSVCQVEATSQPVTARTALPPSPSSRPRPPTGAAFLRPQ